MDVTSLVHLTKFPSALIYQEKEIKIKIANYFSCMIRHNIIYFQINTNFTIIMCIFLFQEILSFYDIDFQYYAILGNQASQLITADHPYREKWNSLLPSHRLIIQMFQVCARGVLPNLSHIWQNIVIIG